MIKSHDFLHAVPGQMATRFDLGTHLFAPDAVTAPRHTCTDPRKIRSVKTLESQLCYNARYAVDYKGRKVPEKKADGRRWALNLGACIECESPCEYGMERLRRLKIHELLELGLSVPQVTKIFLKLREMGVDVPADVYTIPYAVKTLLEAKRRRDAGESLVLPRSAAQKGGAV